MDYTLALTDVADDDTRQAILAPLQAYNAAQVGHHGGKPLVLTVRDAAGRIVGGLWGFTGFEWLFTQLLVVPEDARGRGLGSELMRRAESEARARGCRGAWLDTFDFQARGFYEKLGYAVFGELDDYPTGHKRFFLRKVL